jgi:hypothetical protein
MLTTKREDELEFWEEALRRSLVLKRYRVLSPTVPTLTVKNKQTST